MQRHEFEQMAPYEQLGQYMNTVGGADWGGQTSTPYSTNPLAGGVGGGMAGAGLACMMYTGTGSNPYMWPMMLGGAALGAWG